MNRKLLIISTGTILLGLFAAAVLIYQSKTSGEITSAAHENASLLIRDYSPVKGDPDAKVTIVEFFDPACETCRAFYPFVEQMLEANPGRIRLVLRYTPFHDGSDYVVKVLEAAREQGKYWEVLEAAFASQPAWASHRHPQPQNQDPSIHRLQQSSRITSRSVRPTEGEATIRSGPAPRTGRCSRLCRAVTKEESSSLQ